MNNITPVGQLFLDVENDVNTFETSVNKGDLDLLETMMPIVKEELEQLAKMAQEKGTPIEQERVMLLSSKWDSLVSRICSVVQPSDFVGKEHSLQDLVDMFHSESFPAAKLGLNTLIPFFRYIPIRGDGHCLFRAVAFLLADQLLQQSFEDRDQFFIGLAERVAALNTLTDRFLKEPRSLALLHKEFMDIFMNIASEKHFIREVLNDRVASQKVVAFLRVLSCAQNRVHTDETYAQQAAAYSGSLSEYEAAMTDMKVAELGSEGEVRALAQALGINLQVLDVQSVGNGGEIYPEHLRFITNHGPSSQTGFLLYRPGHYDVAIEQRVEAPSKKRKREEGDAELARKFAKEESDAALAQRLAYEDSTRQKQEETDAKLAKMLEQQDSDASLVRQLVHETDKSEKQEQEASDARLAQKLAREQERCHLQ